MMNALMRLSTRFGSPCTDTSS